MVRKAVEILLLFGILCTLAFCEEQKRSDLWDQARAKKGLSLTPYKTNKAQRVFLHIEKEGLNIGFKGFSPIFGGGSTGSGSMFGARYWNSHILGSRLDLQASGAYSIRAYQLYQFQLGTILQKGPEPFLGFGGTGGLSEFRGAQKQRNDMFLYADLRYKDFPQEDFYGIGPDSQVENRTDYALEETTLDGVFGFKLKRYFLLGVRAGYIHTNVHKGTDDRFPNTEDIFTPAEAPGLLNQPDFFRTSGSFMIDYRDNPGHPHSGGLYGFGYARFQDLDHQVFEFNRYLVDLRQYVPLGSPQRELAARFLTILNEADAGSTIPFYFLDSLGGNDSLRGFREFRFRDNNLVYLSAEYRWEGVHAVEFALFADAGKVFPEISDFSLDRLEKSYGFGVRFKTANATFWRIEIARSNEGTRLVWKFTASF